MSQYKAVIEEAVKIEGVKKILTEVYRAAGITFKDTVGQVVSHINNGGVTDVYQNVKVK